MTRAKFRLLVLTLLTMGIYSSPAQSTDCPPGYLIAANPVPTQRSGKPSEFISLPDQPSAPPKIGSDSRILPIGCGRRFSVGDRIEPLDSHHRQDAENLRPYLAAVPAAVEELNEYQRNKRKARFARYTGTLGLVGALVTFFVVDRTDSFYNVGVWSGIGLFGASVGYSIAVTQSNEEHVTRAVDIHNTERPGRKIELLFRTGF